MAKNMCLPRLVLSVEWVACTISPQYSDSMHDIYHMIMNYVWLLSETILISKSRLLQDVEKLSRNLHLSPFSLAAGMCFCAFSIAF